VKLSKRAAGSSDTFEVSIPACDYQGVHYDERMVTMLRPLRSNDPLAVEMDVDAMCHIVAFIQHKGVSVDTLKSKRPHHTLTYEERMIPKYQRYSKKHAEEEEDDDGELDGGDVEDDGGKAGEPDAGLSDWWGA